MVHHLTHKHDRFTHLLLYSKFSHQQARAIQIYVRKRHGTSKMKRSPRRKKIKDLTVMRSAFCSAFCILRRNVSCTNAAYTRQLAALF